MDQASNDPIAEFKSEADAELWKAAACRQGALEADRIVMAYQVRRAAYDAKLYAECMRQATAPRPRPGGEEP